MVFYKKTVQYRVKEVGIEGAKEVKVKAVFDLLKVVQPGETVTDYNNNLEEGLNIGTLKKYG
jgi:hypothetical protein